MRQPVRNSLNDRPASWRLTMRRLRRFVWPILYTLLGAGVVIVIVTLLRTIQPSTPGNQSLVTWRDEVGAVAAASGLRVTEVVIEGRSNTPETLLRAAIGVSKGDPILGFSVEAARARIQTLSWGERATVERRLPGTVVVFVEERRPYAIWQNRGKWQLVDRNGQVVNQDIAKFRNLPQIVGDGAPAAAAPLIDAVANRPSLFEKLSAVVRVGERRWNLHMKSGVDVLLPEGHETAALDRLVVLEQEHALLDRPLAVIDMRLPDRLVLRPRSDLAKDAPPAAPGSTTPVIAKKPT